VRTYGDVITKFSYPWCSAINGLILEIRESTVDYLWFHQRRWGEGRCGEGGAGVQTCRPPHLAFLAPFPLPGFPTLRAFAIAKYWALYCCVISPISLASHPLIVFFSRPSLSHLSLHFSPGLPHSLLPHYKWFNIKLIVGPLLFICNYYKVNWDRVLTGDVWGNNRTVVWKWHRNRWCVNSRWKLSRWELKIICQT